MRLIIRLALLISLTACSKKEERKVQNAPPVLAAKPTEVAPAAPAASQSTEEDLAMEKAAEERNAANEACASGDRHDCDGDGVRFGVDLDDADPKIGGRAGKLGPLTVQKGSKAIKYAEGCLMSITPGWVVMVPSRAGAKPCDVDGEDDFAISLEMPACPDDAGKLCALPQPGQIANATLYVTGGSKSKTKVTVVGHQKPYIVLSIAPDANGKNGGELRVLVDDTNALVEKSSWK